MVKIDVMMNNIKGCAREMAHPLGTHTVLPICMPSGSQPPVILAPGETDELWPSSGTCIHVIHINSHRHKRVYMLTHINKENKRIP